MAHYIDEREGQIAFYETILKRVDSQLSLEDILSDNNDGVVNGTMLEFKLNLNDLNSTLFQTIKYQSSRRIKGKPVPKNILLIDLNKEQAYLYDSDEYLDDVEKVYIGAASKDNAGFSGGRYKAKYNYGTSPKDAEAMIQKLKEKEYTRIHIDENCIVGWARHFYRVTAEHRKEDFIGDQTGLHRTIGEIRNPKTFKDYIYPYEGENNVKFQYLMDQLNSSLAQKNLGAFYTPEFYAEKTAELLRRAISRVPEGNDYVIIDRCAGTGNLEKVLTDEELSHCIVSTYEYYEYKVLQELLGDKVRHLIPPFESRDTFAAGMVNGADALSKEYVENEIIKQYIDNPNITIILYENPPYAETTSAEHQRQGLSKKSNVWKQSWVYQQMEKELKKTPNRPLNDLGNLFIWSGFKYYLRQPTDSYVLYSPPKYWKAQHLVNKKFLGGFAFNRRWFHANANACLMAILWSNEDDSIEEFKLKALDWDENKLVDDGYLDIKRIYVLPSKAYHDRRPIPENELNVGILCGLDGLEGKGKKRIKPAHGDSIIGYLVADSPGFDNPDLHSSLLVSGRYNGNGFYLRKDNYLEKLPLFAMSRYIRYCNKWTERGRIMKTGDGAERYKKAVESGTLDSWLLKCLLFATLEAQNHMRSFTASDGTKYRNELCLDGDTIASRELKRMVPNQREKALLNQWNLLIEAARHTKEYNPKLTYGVYQIAQEIDTKYKNEKGDIIYNNVEVHSHLQTLREMLKDYYVNEIVPVLFEYEFLK